MPKAILKCICGQHSEYENQQLPAKIKCTKCRRKRYFPNSETRKLHLIIVEGKPTLLYKLSLHLIFIFCFLAVILILAYFGILSSAAEDMKAQSHTSISLIVGIIFNVIIFSFCIIIFGWKVLPYLVSLVLTILATVYLYSWGHPILAVLAGICGGVITLFIGLFIGRYFKDPNPTKINLDDSYSYEDDDLPLFYEDIEVNNKEISKKIEKTKEIVSRQIVLLRSFSDDGLEAEYVEGIDGGMGFSVSLESYMTELLQRRTSRVIKLGEHDGGDPRGATILKTEDPNWWVYAKQMIEESRAILAIAGTTESLQIELEYIFQNKNLLNKLIFVFPNEDQNEHIKRWDHIVKIIKDYSIHIPRLTSDCNWDPVYLQISEDEIRCVATERSIWISGMDRKALSDGIFSLGF